MEENKKTKPIAIGIEEMPLYRSYLDHYFMQFYQLMESFKKWFCNLSEYLGKVDWYYH